MLVACFKIFSRSLINTPYNKRAAKIISFYIKTVIFGIISRTSCIDTLLEKLSARIC